ncbi:protein tyrosine phosphatase non-receptor type 9 [Phyllostomus discolor]|uniref:Protein tyrosine phosphatase non-receptor type 9 n=1 Tax=Phyllostomus discolor TaxID=89673 RepID=A0A834BMG4_9CHIR|nr:protein tyrosine phosphatase non-receptor type 9 [Phyllostomus discolor]
MEPATAPQTDMAPELTPEEEQATKQFLEEINKWTAQYNVSPLSWNVAVKFLMARKFDVPRAIELFHTYRVCSSGVNQTCGSCALLYSCFLCHSLHTVVLHVLPTLI